MWFLQNLLHAGIRISLPEGKDLIIGRKDCAIVISGDPSISRSHATIRVSGSGKSGAVVLTDTKAKFGTHVNGVKLSPSGSATLKCGDELKFGQGPDTGKFKLTFEQLVFCCSSMSSVGKNKVRQLAKKLGGKVVGGWSQSCTHLVMSSLTVTVKVVSALASCRPIITCSWLEAAVTHLAEGKPLPYPEAYLPKMVDTNLGSAKVTFHPDSKRKELFREKVFYILDQVQHTDLHSCVEAAGANCQLIDSSQSVSMDTLLGKEAVVIAWKDSASVSAAQREWRDKVRQFLESNGLRAIQDSEIGFALLHMSTDTHCNPEKASPGSDDISLAPPSLSQFLYNTQCDATPLSPPTTYVPSALRSETIETTCAAGFTQTAPTSKEGKGLGGISDDGVPTRDSEAQGAKKAQKKSSVLDDDFELTPVEVRRKPGPATRQRRGAATWGSGRDVVDNSQHSEDQGKKQLPLSTRQKHIRGKQLESGGDAVQLLEDKSVEEKKQLPLSSRQRRGTSTRGSGQEMVDNSQLSADLSGANEEKKPPLTGLDKTALKTSHAPSILQQNQGTREGVSQSAESSVYAPNSLTPSAAGNTPSKAANGGLPSSGMMKEIFRPKTAKKKKKFFVDDSSSEDEASEIPTKKQCVDSDKGAPLDASVGGPGKIQSPLKQSSGGQSQGNLFGGLWGKGSRKKSDGSKRVVPSVVPVTRKRVRAEEEEEEEDLWGGGRHLEHGGGGKAKTGSRTDIQSEAKRGRVEQQGGTEKNDGNNADDVIAGDQDMPGTAARHEVKKSRVEKRKTNDEDNDDVVIVAESYSQNTAAPSKAARKKKRARHLDPDDSPDSIPAKKQCSDVSKTVPDSDTPKAAARSIPGHNLDPAPDNVPKDRKDAGVVPGIDPVKTECETPRRRRREESSDHTSSHVSATPFLSTRKHKKKLASLDPETELNTSTVSAANTQTGLTGLATPGFSQRSFTSLTLNKHKEDIPLTAVSTGGRRSKVAPVPADALWMKEERSEVVGGGGIEDEDPLGEEFDGNLPGGNYQPVMTEDGFIKARVAPKLKMSRMARLARRTNYDWSNTEATDADSSQAPSQLAVIVGVELVSLVVEGRRNGGRRVLREGSDGEERRSGRLRNFKRFRKAHMESGVPRFVTLRLHMPNVDQKLPDWKIVDGDMEQVSEDSTSRLDNEDSQDVFSLGNRKRPTSRRH